MNKRIDLSQLGGLFMYQDTLDFLQGAYSGPLDAIAAVLGDKVVLSGCQDQGATTGAGWVLYNGEALPFVGGVKAPYITVEEVSGQEQFDDNTLRDVYFTRRLRYGNTAPAVGAGFSASELGTMPFNQNTVKDALSAIQSTFKSVLQLEPAIILDGCAVTPGEGTAAITAGMVLFSGKLVVTPAYNGPVPAFLTEGGTWATVTPATGLYIQFDPYSSQRYEDVRFRYSYRSGQLLFSKVLSDRFDTNTGLGKWEWMGFKLSRDFRGRVPVGMWFGGNDDPLIYDPAYATINNPVGSKTHTLTKEELPAIQLETGLYRNSQDYVDGGAAPNNIGTNPNGQSIKTESLGNGQAFNIVPPGMITAIIERI